MTSRRLLHTCYLRNGLDVSGTPPHAGGYDDWEGVKMRFKKKLLVATLVASMLVASTCLAEQVAYEPEDGGGASFSTHDFIKSGRTDIYYTHYVTKDNTSEHWFRISYSGSSIKLLDNMSLIIDGTRYDITAVPNPGEKYTLAGLSLIDNRDHIVPFGGFVSTPRSNTRFFVLSDEQVEKLKTAKQVKIIIHTTYAVNLKLDIKDKFLASINKMNSYQLIDLNELWKPKDMNGYERTD